MSEITFRIWIPHLIPRWYKLKTLFDIGSTFNNEAYAIDGIKIFDIEINYFSDNKLIVFLNCKIIGMIWCNKLEFKLKSSWPFWSISLLKNIF